MGITLACFAHILIQKSYKPIYSCYEFGYIISTGVLIVGLSRKMRKQGVRISPLVREGQELSSVYIAILSMCFKIGVNRLLYKKVMSMSKVKILLDFVHLLSLFNEINSLTRNSHST